MVAANQYVYQLLHEGFTAQMQHPDTFLDTPNPSRSNALI